MKRVISVLAVMAVMAAMMVAMAAPAFAQGGCKEFGQAVRTAAQAPGPFGERVKGFTPVNDDFQVAKEILCA